MISTKTTAMARIARGFALAAALAVTAGPANAEDDTAFNASFAAYAAVPAAPVAAAGAVDIAAIEPVVEAEPAARHLGSGGASYYAQKFHGRRTASGERFDNTALTAAHRTLPFGSMVRVTNPVNGRAVTVRINDRGPFHGNRVIDVSRAAAEELGLVARGHGQVELALLD
jgi:rare lipoprotein A